MLPINKLHTCASQPQAMTLQNNNINNNNNNNLFTTIGLMPSGSGYIYV
jgi:hypothetical protein